MRHWERFLVSSKVLGTQEEMQIMVLLTAWSRLRHDPFLLEIWSLLSTAEGRLGDKLDSDFIFPGSAVEMIHGVLLACTYEP